MTDRSHGLPLTRQAELLGFSRGSFYYTPCPVPAADLAIIRRIDQLHLDYPFAGSRMLRDLLRGEGIAVGRERVASMMRRMGIEAVQRQSRWTATILIVALHRGAVSASEHLETRRGAQDLSVSAAWPQRDTAEPGVGDGYQCAAASGVRDGGWPPASRRSSRRARIVRRTAS